MKRIKYIAAFGVFGIITTEFGVIGILPQVAQHYHISISTAGILLSAFAFVIAVCGPWVTLLASRYDRKKVMLAALALFIISNILSAFTPSFGVMVLVRVLPAFLHPVYFSAALGAAVGTVREEDRHKAASVIFGGISLATVIGVPLATYMANVFTFPASFVVAGITNVLAWLGVFFFIPSMPVAAPAAYGKQLGIFRQAPFLLALAAACLLLAAMSSIYGYFADYLQKVNGLNGMQISTMLLLFGITGIAGNWAAGKLLSKGITRTMLFFLVALGLIYTGLYFSTGYSFTTIALIAVWGFIHTGCFLIGQAWITATVPQAQDFANSLAVSSGNLGLTIGTVVSGWVITHIDIRQAPWVGVALVLAALLLVWIKTRVGKMKVKVSCQKPEAAPACSIA